MTKFFEELWDEIEDFFEDFSEHLIKGKHIESVKKITVVIDGTERAVRPAYLFAERIDNGLRFIFGLSVLISAVTASFLGFASLSDLLEVLMFSLWGRIIMIFIGFSYLIISVWKLMHLKKS